MFSRRGPRAILLCIALAALFAGCGRKEDDGPFFHAEENPALLSDWGLFSVDGALTLTDGVVPYDLNTPLFTDYAHKLRAVWAPQGQPAVYRDGDVVEFPVGTVISKTFYYPVESGGAGFDGRVLKADYETGRVGSALSDLSRVRLVETRLLVRREVGWDAASYVWNDEQTDALLTRIGDAQRLTLIDPQAADGAGEKTPFTYIVPNENQCAGCHAPNNTTRAISPIGPKPRHLNKDFAYAQGVDNQLAAWRARGLLTGFADPAAAPRNADWRDEAAPIDRRVRAYLDANCSHCHNPEGPADTSGLTLEPDARPGPQTGECKLPIAAGSGTGGRRYGIAPGAPEASIFVFRMASTKPDEMMPELGRSLAHDEGVDLIARWIAAMDGDCG